MRKTDCEHCGVAFNVGNRSCVEISCKSPRKKYYQKKSVDIVTIRLNACMMRSRSRSWSCDLDYEFVKMIISMPCDYCLTIDRFSQLDRKDNSKGYTKDNVVPACRRCNMVKGMYLSYDDMLKVASTLGWRDSSDLTESITVD